MPAAARALAPSLVAALLLGAAPSASAAPTDRWIGRWQVEGGGTRTLEGRRRALRLVDPPDGVPDVALEGAARGPSLRLTGRREARKGITHALDERLGDGAEAEEAGDVEVVVTGSGRGEGGGGRLVVDVRYEIRQGGASRTIEERWVRAGRPDLEITAVSRRSWDPKAHGELEVTFRVLGAPQAVRLRVEVDAPGRIPADVAARRGQQRAAGFYREQGLWPAIHEADVQDGALLEPGSEHTIRWDGRDDSGAERLALSGRYTLVVEAVAGGGDGGGVDGPTPRDERPVFVAPPRWSLVAPRWAGAKARDRRPALDAAELELAPAGYRTTRREGWLGSADVVLEDLQRSAVFWVATHGWDARFTVPTLPSPAPAGANVDPEDLELDRLTAHELRKRLATTGGPAAPLRDVLSVFIWSCRTGSDDSGAASDLPATLIDLGADLVVSFRLSIASSKHETFLPELAERVRAGASLRAASQAAAAEADAQWWSWVDDLKFPAEGAWRSIAPLVSEDHEHYTPLKSVLRIDAAAGIDPATELLIPARYGDSTN